MALERLGTRTPPDDQVFDVRPLVATATAARAHRLHEALIAVAAAGTTEEVAGLVVEHAVRATGARASTLGRLDAGAGEIVITHAHGLAEATVERQRRSPMAAGRPDADAMLRGAAVYVAGPEEMAARYPDSVEGVRAAGFEAVAAVPILVEGEAVAVLFVGYAAAHPFDEEECRFLDALAERCAQSFGRAALYDSERRAREHAQVLSARLAVSLESLRATTDRLVRLQTLFTRLSASLSPRETGAVVLREGIALFAARSAALGVLEADGDTHRILAHAGYESVNAAHWRRWKLSQGPATPTRIAAATRQPVFLESLDDWRARYPDVAPMVAENGGEASVILPLLYRERGVEPRVLGTLAFTWAEAHAFPPEERELLLAFAAACAAAVERARLAAAMRLATRRATFLADASTALAEPLEPDLLLQRLARLPVPAWADYAVVYRLHDDGVVRTAALAHRTVAGTELLRRAEELLLPCDLDAPRPIAQVMRGRQPLLFRDVTMEQLAPGAPSGRHVEIAGLLGATSVVVAPLVARGRPLGALLLATCASDAGGSHRRFGEDDLRFAVALAERAALALDTTLVLREAEEARRAAEEANRAKMDFLATMSHELRTPLNAIGGYAELIELGVRGPVTPEQLEDLGRLQRSQRHLLGLINQVLTHARLEGGTMSFASEAVPLDETLRAAEALVAPQLRAKRLRFTYQSCDPTLRVRADDEKLRQILVNLLSNAVKFTAEGGEVALLCTTGDGSVEIRVRDTGRGIAPERLDSIFEPFVQVDRSRSNPQEGVGLGLAISRDLARGMGGDLTVTSEVGRGSEFVLRLGMA